MKNSNGDKGDRDEKHRGWDRRQFGKVLAVGVGGLMLGRTGSAGAEEKLPSKRHPTGKQLTGEHKVDVAIVGAGLSGLIAARELKRAGKTVLVLEANDRIGGRMTGRKTIEDGYLDYGGQWVGKTQYEMQALVAELRITPFLSYEKGRSIQSWQGSKTGFNGDVSGLLKGCEKPEDLPQKYLAQCERSTLPNCAHNKEEKILWEKLLAISETVLPDRPWASPNAESLDQKTFQTWLKEEGAAGYTNWLPTLQARIGGSGGFEPEQVSLLHMAWTQSVGPQSETPEAWLLCGGAGQIPQRLAHELGNSIELRTPVTGIKQVEGGGVIVTTSTLTVKAKAVIVAIPPPLRNRIKFDPVLDESYTHFSEGSPMGSMSKVHAVYDNAFWRKECLSGSGAGNLKTCEFIADSSRPSGKPGVLTSFIAGDRNRELSGFSKKDVEQLVLDDFTYYFGEQARHPKEFEYINWNKAEWTTGAFTSYLGLGVWTKYGKVGWRKPIGDIFWAGTETSDRWPGYFDGAVRAGKKSAMAVLEKFFLGSEAGDRG